jgi:hypothetical protein
MARLELPSALRWTLYRGETNPILGWYSPGLGCRIPAFTLIGCGRCIPGAPLATRLEFIEAATSPRAAVCRQAVSFSAAGTGPNKTPEICAEGG